MASAGAAGAHPQNMQRDLISAFGMPAEAPAFTWYPVPTKHGLVAHPFLLPHLWFAAIYVANLLHGQHPFGACPARPSRSGDR